MTIKKVGDKILTGTIILAASVGFISLLCVGMAVIAATLKYVTHGWFC